MERQEIQLFNSLKDQKTLNKILQTQNSELETFNHIMSHDLKTPLNTIGSFSQLITQKVKFEDEAHLEYFNFIKSSVRRMRSLIDELLLYNKVKSTTTDFVIVDLNDIVHEIMSNYQFICCFYLKKICL